MLNSSASNSELTGMSGIVPDKWQQSHLLHHMACYSSHTICHWFLFFVFFTRHRCYGNKKEVNTVSRTLLVKPITLGEVPARSGSRELEQCAILSFILFLRIETVDVQEMKGATFSSHSSLFPGSGSTLITVFGQKRERSIGPTEPTAGWKTVASVREDSLWRFCSPRASDTHTSNRKQQREAPGCPALATTALTPSNRKL